MIYIFETEILNSKSVEFSLQKIYGLGKLKTKLICRQLGLNKNFKIADLTNDQQIRLVKTIENSNFIIASDLKKFQISNLRQLIDIKAYRGLRRLKGLPVRGQRTHTNARTARFKRKI